MAEPRKVYLDHNIIHYYATSYPKNWDWEAEYEATAYLVGRPQSVRFVLSLWNIVEASRENPPERVESLAACMEGFDPLWVMERRNIQYQELRAYVFHHWFGQEPFQSPAVFPYLSQITHALLPREAAHVGVNIWTVIKELRNNANGQADIREAEMLTPAALMALQEARSNRRVTPELEVETYRQWFSGLLPDRGPERRAISNGDRAKILEFCVANLKDIFESCPCVRAEEYLSRYRTENPYRQAERQDAIDLMHMAVALGYCDAVVTCDGYLRDQLERYKREVLPALVVARGFSDLKEKLGCTAGAG